MLLRSFLILLSFVASRLTLLAGGRKNTPYRFNQPANLHFHEWLLPLRELLSLQPLAAKVMMLTL